jgi:DNA-binding PadR family transcriptional regulator
MPYLGSFEQLILPSVLQLKDKAYGVSVREDTEERTGRTISIGAIHTTLGRLEERGSSGPAPRTLRATPAGRGSTMALSPEGARELRESYAAIKWMAGGLTSELDRLAEI